MSKDYRFVFFGNPPLAKQALDALVAGGMTPAVIITEPDRPKRRAKNGETELAPIKVWAEEHGIDVFQPTSLKDGEILELLQNSEWDFFVVASYGKLIPKNILDIPHRGVLNIHPSLLPKYRGTSPIRSQILGDDPACGVSIILLDEEMDHGPILAQASIEPDPFPLPGEALDDLLATEGGKLLVEIIPEYMEGKVTPEAQDHANATYVKKIAKEDGHIDLAGDPYQNYLKICAYDGWPGTYFMETRDGKELRVKITDAEFSDDVLTILKVIPEGKKEMDYTEWQRSGKN